MFRDEDDACVLDIQSTAALTSLTVPKLVLEEGTTYFWRAQFIDSKGVASEWSDLRVLHHRNDRQPTSTPTVSPMSRKSQRRWTWIETG